MSLRRKLAEHGFESNDDYQFALDCVFAQPLDRLRCLNVTGRSGRRKTAFASALAQALAYPHVIYHDFTQSDVAGPIEWIDGAELPPLPPFERAVIEACSYSEGEPTILILDQLQAADFREHIRLYQFVQAREWSSTQGTAAANPRTLLLLLISEQPLYHSLHQVSFRIHTDPGRGKFGHRTVDLGMGPEAEAMVGALAALFEAIGNSPTLSEMQRLMDDVQHRVRSEDQLRQSIYGWTEGIERDMLYAPEVQPLVRAAFAEILRWAGADEIHLQ
jgi:hypothetical protein